MISELYEMIVAHYMKQAGSDYLRFNMRLKWSLLAAEGAQS